METTTKKSGKKMWIIGSVALVAIAAGAIVFLSGNKYETTDNAQLDGDIFSIKSGITAYAKEIRFNDNQLVKKGDTLIIFDTDELKAKVMQAQAALENAKANRAVAQNRASAGAENAAASQKSAESNTQAIVSAKARLEKAQKDFNRIAELVKIKAATQEQVDNAQANLVVAKSDYARAIDQQQSSVASSSGSKAQARAENSQVDLASAQIVQREAELLLAKKQLSYAFVVAPCNGVVTKRSLNEGQYITTGQSLCAVVNTDKFWVTANMKETQVADIKVGNEVKIELDSYPGVELKGKVESYGGATGAKFSLLPPDNATGNFIKITQRVPLRISLDELPEAIKHEVLPGLSAFVKVKVN